MTKHANRQGRTARAMWMGLTLSTALCATAAASDRPTADGLPEPVRIVDAVPSPDGQRVTYAALRPALGPDAREPGALYVAPADGGPARLYASDVPRVSNPAWSPDGRWLAYLEHGHGRGAGLMLIPAEGGAARLISPPNVPVRAFQWSPAGNAIAFLRPEPPPQRIPRGPHPQAGAGVVGQQAARLQLWWLMVDGQGTPGAARRLTPHPYHVANRQPAAGFDWSPDGREIAFTHTRSPAADDWKTADISVVNVGDGRIRTFQQSDAAEFNPTFSPDGRHLAFDITVFPPSAVRQWRVGLARPDGSGLKLLAATPDEQPRIVGWITNRTLLIEEPHRTVTALWRLPADGGEPRRFDAGDAVLSAVKLNEPATRLAFAAATAQRPQEVAVTALRQFAPVTVSNVNAGWAEATNPTSRVVDWRSSDGREIEGMLTLPADHRPGRRHALVLALHDGPAGVFTRDPHASPGYPVSAVALASRGYAVLRANPRGSSGYGYPFRAAARGGQWQGVVLDDVMSGVDHLIDAGIADPERLAIMGWGHGGYLAALATVRTHRFATAILGAPMTDLLNLRLTGSGGGFVPDYLGAEPYEQPALYRELSPLSQAHRITTPTLIVHGSVDRRVPEIQGRALYRALALHGLDSRMLSHSAGHRWPRAVQRLVVTDEVLDWLEQHVPAGE